MGAGMSCQVLARGSARSTKSSRSCEGSGMVWISPEFARGGSDMVSMGWQRSAALSVGIVGVVMYIGLVVLMPSRHYHTFALVAIGAGMTAIIGVWGPVYGAKPLVLRLLALAGSTVVTGIIMIVLTYRWPSVNVYVGSGRVDSASPAVGVVLLTPIVLAMHVPQALFPTHTGLYASRNSTGQAGAAQCGETPVAAETPKVR